MNEIATEVTVRRAAQTRVNGQNSERVFKITQKFLDVFGIGEAVQVEILSLIPEHVGLGSGTQLALAIGIAINELFGLKLSVREIASLSERGARSGIGIGTFEHGGLIVDGGRALDTETPPTICRLPFPADWRFILVFDRRGQGLNGTREIEAFRRLTSFPEANAARICHLLLMKALPALAEQDLAAFGHSITEIQQSVGDYFAPAQGGRFMSAEVETAIAWLGGRGAVAMGQSSWGPTGFCVVENEAIACDLVDSVSPLFRNQPELSFRIVSAQNQGGATRVLSNQVITDRAPVRMNSKRS